MISTILRWTGIAIATAALVDPSVAISGRSRPRIAIVTDNSQRAAAIARDLEGRLRTDFEIMNGADSAAVHTIAIGSRYPDVPTSGTTSTVSLDRPDAAAPRIAAVDAPRAVPPETAVHIAVDVVGGRANTTSTLVVSASGIEVGRASHTWTAGGDRWRAELDVVPVSAPPFRFHVQVLPTSAGQADIVVDTKRDPLRVLVYEPRPSWASTFVRRALESDARFRVSAVTDVSRGIAVRTPGGVALDTLPPDEIDVAVIGGLDRLSDSDAAWLGRFMRERGGAVALIPDTRIERGPAQRLLGDSVTVNETLLEQAAPLVARAPLPRLDASELLTFSSPHIRTLATLGRASAPVVATLPRGNGELLVSGALDAWRYRAESGVQFDPFWRAVIAGLALGARESIEADVVPRLLPPGATGRIRVHVRRPRPNVPVSASVEGAGPIRLRPGPATGEFSGIFTAPKIAGPHAIRVSARDVPPRSATVRFLVGEGIGTIVGDVPPLSLLSASRGGIDVDERHLDRLAPFLQSRLPAAETVATRSHPMRSSWWFPLFLACLCGDWWLRRQKGLP
jgi:hypothetical protein